MPPLKAMKPVQKLWKFVTLSSHKGSAEKMFHLLWPFSMEDNTNIYA